VKYHFSK